MNIHNSSDSPYIFWLFDCQPKPIARRLRITPRYVRCDISRTGILIHDSPRNFHIPFDMIQECTLYDLHGLQDASGVNIRVKFFEPSISAKEDRKTIELFLLPANVFKHYEDGDDLETMFTIIQAFRSGQTVTFEKNPYHRRLLRQDQEARIHSQIWDPTLPPSYYGTPPTLGRLLMRIILVVLGVGIVGMLVAAIGFYLLTKLS